MSINQYFKSLYRYTMDRAYETAYQHISAGTDSDSKILDCGANDGSMFDKLAHRSQLNSAQYHGIEWDAGCVKRGQAKGLNIVQGDLNAGIPFDNEMYSCVYGLSLLEHLLNPCRFMRDAHRVLKPGGQLVLLTPNISTYFTAILILLGKMPSSGPHPDSELLVKSEELFKLGKENLDKDIESDTPQHRHLVVFSYRVLNQYLATLGFSNIKGYGFGHYPFPKLMQPLLEKIDPYHCHQMVFVARK